MFIFQDIADICFTKPPLIFHMLSKMYGLDVIFKFMAVLTEKYRYQSIGMKEYVSAMSEAASDKQDAGKKNPPKWRKKAKSELLSRQYAARMVRAAGLRCAPVDCLRKQCESGAETREYYQWHIDRRSVAEYVPNQGDVYGQQWQEAQPAYDKLLILFKDLLKTASYRHSNLVLVVGGAFVVHSQQ